MKAKDFVTLMQIVGVAMLLYGYAAPNAFFGVLGVSLAVIGGLTGRMNREDAR